MLNFSLTCNRCGSSDIEITIEESTASFLPDTTWYKCRECGMKEED